MTKDTSKPKKKNMAKLSDALKKNIKRRKEIQTKKKTSVATNTN